MKILRINSQIIYQFLSCIFIFYFSILNLFSQNQAVPSLNPEKHLTHYSIDIWGTNEGLPTKALLYLTQTRNGYLWISSFQGVVRFDGVNFKAFNTQNTSGVLKTNSVKGLFEREDGTLCIGSSSSGLVGYKNGKFSTIGDLDASIQVSLFDKPEHAWVGTKTKGVFEFNNGTFKPYNKIEALTDVWIFNIFKDSKGNIWFSTEGNGLVKLTPDGNHKIYTTKEGLITNKVRVVFEDRNSKIWVGTYNGLCYIEDNEIKVAEGTESYPINKILEDYYGSIWMASEKGILRINSKTNIVEVLNNKNGLPHKNIQDIILDREGSLWFASYRAGLGRIKEGKFSNYTIESGLASKAISAIHEINKNEFLVATDAGIINRIKDNEISEFKFKTKLPNTRLKNINSDSKGNIYISTYAGLLIIYTDGKEKFLTEKNGLPGKQTRMTIEDHQGNIWIGTRANGLVKMDKNGGLTVYNKKNSGLASNFIMSLRQDKRNSLVVGTNNGGLDVINIENGFEIKNYANELTGKLIFNTYTDNNNVIWVGTNAGINRIENGKVTKISTKTGLVAEDCFDILEDGLGNFWIPTSSGIMKINKEELDNIANGKQSKINSLVLFGKPDGMVTRECTGAAFSIKTQEGKFMFPTLSGVTFIDPANISTNKVKPPVDIQGLIVDNKETDIYSTVKFDPGKQRFTFYFTALSLIAPQSVSFKYRLENYDKSWNDSKGERQAIYTGLPHGNYTLKIKAANNDGVWNEDGASLSFEIAPHFYETTIFYLFSILIIGLAIYSFYKIRTRSIKRKNQELEAIVEARTEKINAQNEELMTQKEELSLQKDKIEIKNQQITASIRYAERIQQAVLPSQNLITKTFNDSFIFFSPKDIVSGDFYWFNQVGNKKFIVVADCTGHGVPGAFMSMIGITLLNETVIKEQVFSPSEILKTLNEKVMKALKQDQNENNDGMDLGLCLIEENNGQETKVTFAGAKRPLYYSENGNLQELKGDRMSIGGSQIETVKDFSEETITLNQGENIYLFSDGLIDQNDKDRSRFGSAQLKSILNENINLPLQNQKEKLLNALKNHQGKDLQRDDMVMVGIKF